MTEGSTIHNPTCAVDVTDVNETDYNCANHNPYFSSPDDGKSQQQWVKLQIPLHTGIFRSKKIFPVVSTSGLRIEIMLEEAKKVIKNLITSTDPKYCPKLYGISAATAGIAINTATKTIALSKLANNIKSVSQCPFKVGEEITVSDADGSNPEVFGILSSISMSTTYVLLTVATSFTFTTAHATETALVYSTSIGDTYAPTFTVDEVELVLQKIEVPPDNVNAMLKATKEQGVMKYDFLSFQNYKFAQQAGITQATMNLNLNNSEIKSILSVPIDSQALAKAGDYIKNHFQHGFVGIADNISNYQWMYGGVLNPDRRVPMSKLNSNNIEQQHLVELEKALVVAGIPAKSFRRNSHQVVIGRALSLQKGSYDGRGKDFNLQVAYEETAPPAKNKIFNNFICHIRSIEISSTGINVQS